MIALALSAQRPPSRRLPFLGKRKGEEMRKERPIINNSRNRITRLANSKHLGKESDLLQEMALY